MQKLCEEMGIRYLRTKVAPKLIKLMVRLQKGPVLSPAGFGNCHNGEKQVLTLQDNPSQARQTGTCHIDWHGPVGLKSVFSAEMTSERVYAHLNDPCHRFDGAPPDAPP